MWPAELNWGPGSHRRSSAGSSLPSRGCGELAEAPAVGGRRPGLGRELAALPVARSLEGARGGGG